MSAPELSKRSLGTGYVVSAGVALSIALLAHAVVAFQIGQSWLLVVLVGLVPALVLVTANYWLPRCGIEGQQAWTVAEWCGLGIALLTLVNVAVILAGIPVLVAGPELLASSVAIAGLVGLLVGTLVELRRSNQRLAESNDVLNRVLRHDMRNDLNVVLGRLSELERTTSGEATEHTEELRSVVDEMIATTEKASRIDVALAADRRCQDPIDLVPYVEERVDDVEGSYPEADIEATHPSEAMVHADWLLGAVLDNLIENTVVHSTGDPSLSIAVDVDGPATTVRIRDNCPAIPDNELDVFSGRAETPLQHSKGVGLWLVIWVVESYGGEVSFDRTDGGNVVTLELRTATWLARKRCGDWLPTL